MFQVNEDNSIYATRGDIVFFKVSADDNGEAYQFKPGDIVRIKIFGKKDAETVVLQKDFPILEATQRPQIYLTGEDTKIGEVISKPRDYWYEIELNPDTDPQTIIGYDEDGPKVFRLFPEGDDIPPYVPDITPEDIPIVDEELDVLSPRPVQNKAIARAIARVYNTIAELQTTPDSFGGIGDGEADDTEALQAAFDSGKKVVNLMGKTYRITSPIRMSDGQVIQNGTLDGGGVCERGIECTSLIGEESKRVNIINVTVRNFTEYGIYLKRCTHSLVANCKVENIVNNTSGAIVKGICLEFCTYTAVEDCVVHNVVSLNDADGIHFMHQDTTEEEVFSGNEVRNCVTYDCGKRHYKIQQFGVTMDGCRMLSGELGINVSSSLVSVYDSYFTMKNCFLDAQASNPVIIGANNDEADHDYRYIIINKNRFIHRGTAYQGAIFLANAVGCNYRDIIITDNSFLITNNTEYALYIRKDFMHVVFNDNIVNGGNSAVCVRDAANGGTLSCNSNHYDGDFTLVYLTNATVDILSAVGNLVKLNSGDRTVYLAGSNINAGRVNNTREDGVHDMPFTNGTTSSRPTVMLYNGFQYYDQTLQKPIYYYNGLWKDAAGANV